MISCGQITRYHNLSRHNSVSYHRICGTTIFHNNNRGRSTTRQLRCTEANMFFHPTKTTKMMMMMMTTTTTSVCKNDAIVGQFRRHRGNLSLVSSLIQQTNNHRNPTTTRRVSSTPPQQSQQKINRQNAHTFRVNQISHDGSTQFKSLTVADILRNSSIHARDLVSLALSTETTYGGGGSLAADNREEIDRGNNASTTTRRGGQQQRRRRREVLAARKPSPVILPRGENIIVSFGHVRAVIGEKEGMLFDAHHPNIEIFARNLSLTFSSQDNNNNITTTNGNNDLTSSDPFEITFLESILREATHTWSRRISLYTPIVDSLTTSTFSSSSSFSSDFLSDTGVQRLIPLQNALVNFEMHLSQAHDCLLTLLEDDNDMASLVLSERSRALQRGTSLDVTTIHESVELLLEEYSRQIQNLLREISFLIKTVQNRQQLIKISLDSYRNRMLQLEVSLSVSAVVLATSTTVAGFWGMNLRSGLEDHPTLFWDVVAGTSLGMMLLGCGCMYYASSKRLSRMSAMKFKEMTTITGLLTHMTALDFVCKVMAEDGSVIDKTEFKRMLEMASVDNEVTQDEADLLFQIFDQSRDNLLQPDELSSFIHKS